MRTLTPDLLLTFPRHCLASALAISLFGGSASAAPKKTPAPDVLVVADVITPESEIVRPAPSAPIYYVFLGGLERDLGSSWAGLPPPPPAEIRAAIAKALASQGYIETKIGGPLPTQAVVYTYGTAVIDSVETTETDDETGETTTSSVSMNAREIYRLVGADKASRRLMSSSDADVIRDALNSDRFYIFIGALDVAALRAKKNKLVWRTRMSIDSRRHTLVETMDIMLASAAPYFGRNVDRPVVIDDSNRNRRENVEIGEMKVLETDVKSSGKK